MQKEHAVEIGGKQIEFDKDGFMRDPNLWDEIVAEASAAEEGTAHLSDKHWHIVNFIRHYLK